MKKRFTPELIDTLKLGEIFVFGSNEAGIHGAGAARKALEFGAKLGQGYGRAGQTFALPTKDWEIKQLPLGVIKFYVERFIGMIKCNGNYTFLITKIGCGLAGFTVEDIAPMFREVYDMKNVVLPEEFHDFIKKNYISLS